MDRVLGLANGLAPFLVLMLSTSLLLSSCVSTAPTTGPSVTTTTTTTTTTITTTGTSTASSAATSNPGQPTSSPTSIESTKSALPVVNFPYPGPYQTVMMDGVEMRQGRFPIGKQGGSLVRSIVGSDVKTFNWWAAADTLSGELASLMFGATVGIDPFNGEVIPDMAESFKVDPDGVTYYTKLRKGLKWSDGKPITADDVAFTWNSIIAGGYGNSSSRDVRMVGGKFPTVTVVDEVTNKYVTPKPFAPFLRLLGVAIAPKHVIEPILKRKDGRQAFQAYLSPSTPSSSFVTSGPFVVKRYVPAQRVEFVPTKNFYEVNKDKQKLPYLESLIYLIVPDVNANLLKFKAKEIDNTVVRARDVAQLMTQQEKLNFKLYNVGPSVGTTFIMFNMNQRKNPKSNKPYVDPMKSVWFNDTNFRQAVNHVLNRDQMVANYFKGIGAPLFTAEPIASPYHNNNLSPFKQDYDYARGLLTKSGFKTGSTGELLDKNGKRVEFNLTTSSGGTFYETIGNMIVADLKRLGIKVNFQEIDGNVLLDKIESSLDWECVLMSLSPGDPLEPNDGANVYKSSGRMHLFDQRLQDDSGNIVVTDARPWEKRLDELFDTGATTLDKQKRHQIYDEYQKIIYDEAPFIYLVSPMTIIGNRNTIQNYQPTPLSQNGNGFHNLEEIWKGDTGGATETSGAASQTGGDSTQTGAPAQ